ncbi:MAG: hypothetical protein J1E40_00350 [Oscillospiraceae bacterium]|nr:hypothetical protein [Oscillospiraceae bacterium]
MYDTIYSLYYNDDAKINQYFYSHTLNENNEKCHKLIKELESRLDEESKTLLKEYTGILPEIEDEEKRRAFLCGVQTGARLMIEIFTDDQDG